MSVLFFVSCLLARSLAAAGLPSSYAPGEAIVLFHPGPSRADLSSEAARLGAKGSDPAFVRAALHASVGATLLREIPFIQADYVKLPAGLAIRDAISAYERSPLVRRAEPNWLARAVGCNAPSDPWYSAGLQKNLSATAWPRALEAWCAGSIVLQSTVIVAVIDTGVDPHPDLAGQLLGGANFYDGNGGHDDDQGHGTFVAGLIAAGNDNGQGMAGAFFDASKIRILPVKVLGGASGTGSVAGIASGIGWAVDRGARVLNLSLGTGANSEALELSVNEARARDVLLVAATGNDDVATSYPAAYGNAFAVASLAANGHRAFYSNYGKVELSAPGGESTINCNCTLAPSGCGSEVWSLCKDGAELEAAAGTSFSAPLVAAAAALLLSQDPTRRVEELHVLLTQSASQTAYGPGWHREVGWGKLDFYRALTYDRKSSQTPAFKAYNWPNPFNPSKDQVTQLVFHLKAPGDVQLKLLDAGGAVVWLKELGQASTYAGMNQVTWDGRNSAGMLVANSAYTLVLRSAEGTATVMVAVLR